MTPGNGPQKENGYTAIANEIMEQLAMAPISRDGFRCVLFLLRKTYGYNRKTDRISLAQWAEGTGLKRQNVWRELQRLQAQRIIVSAASGPKSAKTWRFNKHYNEWIPQSVIAGDDSSVIADDDSADQSVIAGDDASVIKPHERTKERKQAAAAAESSTKNERDPWIEAYEQTLGMVPNPFIAGQVQDWSKRVTLDGWRYALMETAKGKGRTWGYTESILLRIEVEGYVAPAPAQSTPTVDFTVEELYGHR